MLACTYVHSNRQIDTPKIASDNGRAENLALDTDKGAPLTGAKSMYTSNNSRHQNKTPDLFAANRTDVFYENLASSDKPKLSRRNDLQRKKKRQSQVKF